MKTNTSTGPITKRGKVKSSKNALKHGLLSKEVLLSGESRQKLSALKKALEADLQPVGAMEQLMVDRIISGVWRYRRFLDIERTYMSMQIAETQVEEVAAGINEIVAALHGKVEVIKGDDLERLVRYESSIDRGIYRALHELRRLQQRRIGDGVSNPDASVNLVNY